jgi:thymidylate synthase
MSSLPYVMQPYDDALAEILENGVPRTNKRTGIKTLAIFGVQKRYNIADRFPIVTRRKVWPKSIFAELLWFLSGSTNNKDLQAMKCNIWTPWVDPEFEKKHGYAEGSLGPVYGFQLRHFGGHYGNGIGGLKGSDKDHFVDCDTPYPYDKEVTWKASAYGTHPVYSHEKGFDQLAYMMERITNDPSDRRILFSLWNPLQLNGMRLPPCHYTFQVFIDDEGRMSGMLTQRSCDFPVGVPANIQFYSALIHMLAQQTGYTPHEFIHSCADAHIYEDQIPAVQEYLTSPVLDSPRLKLNKAADIYSYTLDDFKVVDYVCGPKITIPVAV